jgi:hypothetical protein
MAIKKVRQLLCFFTPCVVVGSGIRNSGTGMEKKIRNQDKNHGSVTLDIGIT